MELRRYWAMFRRWLWLIALTTILAAGAAYGYDRTVQPVYQASTTLLVNLANTPGTVAYSDLQASQNIAQTYSQLVKTRPVLDEVVKSLNLPISSGQLDGCITVQVVRSTQLMQLNVNYPNPEMARDIANKTAEVFIAQTAALQQGQYQSSQEKLSLQIATVENDVKQIGESIAALKATGTPVPGSDKEVQLNTLQSQLTQSQSEYVALLASYNSARVAEGRALNFVAVAEPAIAPSGPVKPKPLNDALLGAVVGLMLGVGVAFLIEYLDDTVKTPEDVERIAGVATLAQVYLFRPKNDTDGREAGLVAKRNPKSLFVESYRVLRTNLQYSSADNPLRTLMVTSPVSQEGKTTTSVNLAAIMGQAGKRVILVDADLRRPALHKMLGLENSAGLTSVLVNEALDVSAVIQPMGVDGVQVITSGPRPPNPAELVGSARMATVLRTLAEMSDVVIIDTPPVLFATDAPLLAAQVDGVIVVVEAGKTRSDGLGHTVEALLQVKENIVGAVINKVGHGGDGYYAGYYRRYYRGHYGYGYGHGYGYGSDEKQDGSNGRGDKSEIPTRKMGS